MKEDKKIFFFFELNLVGYFECVLDDKRSNLYPNIVESVMWMKG